MSDLRTQRDRYRDLDDAIDNAIDAPVDCAAAMLVTTTMVTTYPTTAGAFFAANPTDIDGSEVEGGAATYTADTTQVAFGLNVGSAIPPVGTRVVLHAVGGRWVFRFDG